jgi:hypothetical protein
MITRKQLNPKGFTETKDISENLDTLLVRVNGFLAHRGNVKPYVVTSGLRSIEDHKRIYLEKAKGKPVRIPMGSKHLSGKAVDIYDPDGSIMKFCRENPELLSDYGLWVEDDTSVPRVHLQSEAPLSGKRFFKP